MAERETYVGWWLPEPLVELGGRIVAVFIMRNPDKLTSVPHMLSSELR